MKRIRISKKQWLFAGLVVLLCVTGLVNYWFSESVGGQNVALVPTDNDQPASAQLSFYTTFRGERKTAREQEIAYLDAMIADAKTDESMAKKAQEQKLALVTAIEQEMTVEGLIKSLGFAECIVTIREGSINVVVENSAALTAAQAAQIFEIVRTETGESGENVKIMPRN